MPSGRSPPSGFGMDTRRTGSGRYVFETSSSRSPASHLSRPDASIAEGHVVRARRTRICSGKRIGVTQDVLAVDLVVEQVDAEGRLRLRLTIQLSLKGPDLLRCYQAHRQSPSPHRLRKHTRSQGPSLHRHCPASTVLRPCPTPARAAASRDVEAATLTQDGPPPITRTTFPTCRAHYPGGSSGCACRLLPRLCSLPQWPEGRHPHCCHEAPTQPVARPRRSLATGPIDNFPGTDGSRPRG